MNNTAPTFTPPVGPGYVLKDISLGDETGGALVLGADGSIFVSGTSQHGSQKELVVVRFSSDGGAVAAYGRGGVFRTSAILQSDEDWAYTLVASGDGRLIVAGHTPVARNTDMAVSRLNSDGSVDTSFGTNGLVHVDFAGNWDASHGVLVQPDGRVLIEGLANNAGVALVRLTAEGSLDPTFGTGGKIIISDSTQLKIKDFALLGDGRIVLAGYDSNFGHPSLLLMRVNSDGSLDDTFGVRGHVDYHGPSNGQIFCYSIAALGDGSTVVAGEIDGSAFVAKFLADGRPDPTFGSNGFVVASVGDPMARFTSLAVLGDGDVVAAGVTYGDVTRQEVIVARYNSDGSLDSTFGAGGLTEVAIARPTGDAFTNTWVQDLAIDPQGRIVIGGDASNGVDHDFSVLRFLPNGSLDTSFGRLYSLGGEAEYLVRSPAVRVDFDAAVYDAELAGLNGGRGNYAGARVLLQRQGGPVAADEFVAVGDLRFDQGRAILSGLVVGDVVAGGGSLSLGFNDNATQAVVNETLRSIGYRNDVLASPANINIEWRFSDGNRGAQGSGGASDATGLSALHLSPRVEDYPYWVDSLIYGASTFEPGRRYADAVVDQLGSQRTYYYSFPSTPPAYLKEELYYPALSPFTAREAEIAREICGFISSVANIKFVETDNPLQLNVLSMMNTSMSSGFSVSSAFAQYPWNYFLGSDVFIGSSLLQVPEEALSQTLRHEIGHALGLKHPFEPNVLPSSEDRNAWTILAYNNQDEAPDSPTYPLLDIAALQAIYGPNPKARAGNDVYVLSKDHTNFIWDGAGVDTIDGSAVQDPITLHMQPGEWDFLGYRGQTITSPGQITINYGTTIEAFWGGRGDDLVFGNAAGNNLSGGAGSDALHGGLGNDTADGGVGDDRLFGDEGNDALTGGLGDDILDGGAGTDTAAFTRAANGYTVARAGTQWRVTDKLGLEGTDTLVSMEKLQLADKIFDLANLPRASAPAYNTNNGFLFDAVYYLLDNPELVPTQNLATALAHFFATGAAQGKAPNAWFDPVYYSNRWADLTTLHLGDATLFKHYNLYGVWEGRSAGPKFDHFDGNRYLAENPDVAAYVDANVADFLGSRTNGAIAHFIIYGANEQRVSHDVSGASIDMGYLV